MVAANTFKLPELELTPAEANKISEALENLDQRTNIIVDPRTKAIYDLCRVLGSVYGSRAIAIYVRKQAEKTSKPAPTPASATRPAQPQPQQQPQPQPQPRPAMAPVMQAHETMPARPAAPMGEDPQPVNDPLLHAVLQRKPNGTVPVVTGEDPPILTDVFANFDPKNIKVMN